MLSIAAVTKNDVIYDLGSGDGGLLSRPRKNTERAASVWIDPEQVKEANANAVTAGVTDRVSFSNRTF